MLLLLILFGAALGAIASEEAVFGALLGAIGGWLLQRATRLEAEVLKLQQRLRTLEGRSQIAQTTGATAVVTPPPAAAAKSTATPAPVADDTIASADADADARAAWAMRVEATPGVSPAAATRSAATPSDSPSMADVAAPAVDAVATPPPRMPSRPAAAPPPDWTAPLVDWVRRWFTEGNVPVKVGMLVLFVGVAALLKFAAEQGMFTLPIELRLAAIGAAGVAALAFGWRQREAKPLFALALQGGAIGVLLLTVFAAFGFWKVLPAGLAFALVLLLVAGSAALALLQNAIALAVLGSVGGFLAPVLISTGSGNHVALFSYYAVLNLAVFAIAWVRPWRVLNLVGFGFTFAVGSLWGSRYYRPEHFATTEPFLVLFFLFYVAIAVLYALRQPTRRGLVDGTLLFGTPLLAFPLQAALLGDNTMGLAWSALVMAVLYAALAGWLMRRDGLRTLALSFAALALGFATLAVPLALSADWTACTWALEGAALIWLGLRQQQRLPVWSGIALQVLAGIAWIIALDDTGMGREDLADTMFVNGQFLGGLLLAASAMFGAFLLQRSGDWPRAAWTGLVVGLGWWTLTGLHELERFDDYRGAVLGWLALSLVALGALRQRLPWPRLAWPMLAATLAAGLLAIDESNHVAPPLRQIGAVTWPLLLLAALFALRTLRDPDARGLPLAHAGWLGIAALVAGLELHARVGDGLGDGSGWALVVPMLPLAGLLWATWRRPRIAAFPLADAFVGHRLFWFVPASVALLLWWLGSLFEAGAASPLPFLPLLNPLELGQVGLFALLFGLWRSEAEGEFRRQLPLFAAGFAFVTISSATLRAVHHLAGLGWDDRLLGSMLAQTSLTVVWSVLGVAAWIWGSKRGSRPVWLAGAVLMGVVLAKLILVDRSHMGNMPGIVSFLAVGLLLTVVGYFAPSPPARPALAGEQA